MIKPVLIYLLILLALGVGLIFDQIIPRSLEASVYPVDKRVDPCDGMSATFTLLTGNV
jgi:hypothetical protein